MKNIEKICYLVYAISYDDAKVLAAFLSKPKAEAFVKKCLAEDRAYGWDPRDPLSVQYSIEDVPFGS